MKGRNMVASVGIGEQSMTRFKVQHRAIYVQTHERFQFVDLTDVIADIVRQSRVQNGWVNVQTRHTTTAIVVNEHEPLLLEDMKKMLERMAPQDGIYQHDDFDVRTVNMGPDEPANGHAHCKAILLGASETLNIVDGELGLGRWQRIFLIELDQAKERTVSVMIMGET
ncbi:MAG: secondary thiamine-phosphate synthase enzyme YjbQ [Acidobacteriota bacterium]|nr:secondary thiamine-phosphate synthase enzyme YjbQ [Blastocatellia bacterium]MDW8240201.1 secondary thiamine-phosphate synthase enzyme YjbQ [Acidobacteriota bacterium]